MSLILPVTAPSWDCLGWNMQIIRVPRQGGAHLMEQLPPAPFQQTEPRWVGTGSGSFIFSRLHCLRKNTAPYVLPQLLSCMWVYHKHLYIYFFSMQEDSCVDIQPCITKKYTYFCSLWFHFFKSCAPCMSRVSFSSFLTFDAPTSSYMFIYLCFHLCLILLNP